MEYGYCISFAKVALDKNNGISLIGIFFGGVTTDEDEAAKLATHCVDTIKGYTILPMISEIDGPESLLDILDDATEKFEKKIKQMQEAYVILNKPIRKRSKTT